jgi:hypothetical protein
MSAGPRVVQRAITRASEPAVGRAPLAYCRVRGASVGESAFLATDPTGSEDRDIGEWHSSDHDPVIVALSLASLTVDGTTNALVRDGRRVGNVWTTG